jgi:hypothetical protein
MPLRYAYESMIISQAVRNPFERERLSLQRRLEQLTQQKELAKGQAERLEIMKTGLTKLLAAGAPRAAEAEELTMAIANVARRGTREQIDDLRVWPQQVAKGKKIESISDYFVNSRIDLMTREAETFRTDYRNKKKRAIFLAIEQPLWGDEWIRTDRRNGILLGLLIFSGPALTTWLLGRQNRRVRP